MHRLTIGLGFLAAFVLSSSAPPAHAEETSTTTRPTPARPERIKVNTDDENTVVVDVSVSGGEPGRPVPTTRPRPRPKPRVPPRPLPLGAFRAPLASVDATGTACSRVRVVDPIARGIVPATQPAFVGQQNNEGIARLSATLNNDLTAGRTLPRCTRASVTPSVPAREWIEDFLVEDDLPVPVPEVPPGDAITGHRSYLRPHGSPIKHFVHFTPAGLVTLMATSRYLVDWGDGTLAGPYDANSATDRTISHVYQWVDHYDVVVFQDWTVHWELKASDGTGTVVDQGTIDGLRTIGTIPDFRVYEIQAVITEQA